MNSRAINRKKNRFVLVHPDELQRPLPRHAQCGIWRCRIFHKGQFDTSKTECYNCFSDEHQSKHCPNEKACVVCRKGGHEPGDPDCEHYHQNKDMLPFGGAQDPLSNHFEHEFFYNHVPALTLENHWFHQKGYKNGQSVLGDMCLEAKTGKEAKYLGNGIRCLEEWDESVQGYELMKDIVRAKINQVTPARDALYEAWLEKKYIVEAVPNSRDTFWGSGLGKEATMHTLPKFWPGKNSLGRILMEVADEIWDEHEAGWEDYETESATRETSNKVEEEAEPTNKPPPTPENEETNGNSENHDVTVLSEQEISTKVKEFIAKQRAEGNHGRNSSPPGYARKLRRMVVASGHVSRSRSPAKKTNSPRSSSEKRKNTSPVVNSPQKKQVKSDTKPSKYTNGTGDNS